MDSAVLEEYHGDKKMLINTVKTSKLSNTLIIEKILCLLIQDYTFSVQKNRNTEFLNPIVIEKFRNLLRKYHGKSKVLNDCFEDFLNSAVYDYVDDTRATMREINRRILQMQNKEKVIR